MLVVVGCAPQGGSNGAVVVITDPNHFISSRHWEVLDLPGDTELLAAVTGADPRNLISLGCQRKDNGLSLSFAAKSAPVARAKVPHLTLAYDGAPPADPQWIDARTTDGIRGFDTFFGQPGFQPEIDNLKQHDTVEVTLEEAGDQILRDHFTLDGAPAAINYVLAACGKKDPA
jgi:hypothetical protein